MIPKTPQFDSYSGVENLPFFGSWEVHFPQQFDAVIPKTPLYEGMVV